MADNDHNHDNDSLTCTICHEAMEPYHQIVRPKNCTHTFHAICINIWLAKHRSCPLCRRRISLATQMPWRTLFAVALTITQENAFDRATYTYVFLSRILRTYKTCIAWKQARNILIAVSERFEIGTTRLPFLDLTTRTRAKAERKKWLGIFEQLTGEGVRTSERIKSARRIVENTLLI